jgi:hypothetical protein
MSNHSTGRTLAIGFTVAAAIGLAVGILYGSDPGKKLRIKMSHMADDLSARVNKFSHPEKYSRIRP